MKILVVLHEPQINRDEDVSAGAVRTRQITDAITAAGHEVSMACLSCTRARGSFGSFSNGDQLQSLILQSSPDVILVSNWDLASLLPYDLAIPVVLDLVSLRPLQELSNAPDSAAGNVRAVRNAVARCDLIMVGSENQQNLLIYTLIEAGFDLEKGLPLIVVPPGGSAAPLIAWLTQPVKADRIGGPTADPGEPPSLAVPPLGKRIGRQWRLIREFVLPRLLGLGRSRKPAPGHGVIIVTRGDLFPPDHGAAVRTLETAHALARSGARVGLVTDNRSHWFEITREGITRQRVPWRARLLSLPDPVVKLMHHSKNLPYSNSFLYLPLGDGSWYWRILAANRRISARVLQAEFPAYARPCLDAAQTLACGVVLVEHNVEYDRLRKQVPELSKDEYENLKAIEIDLCRRSNAVVCVSDNDRRKLEADGVARDRLHTIPHGVNLAAADSPPEPGVRERFGIEKDAPLLVYHGTYSYPPNREVLGIFATRILPGLEEAGLKCHLLAVGRNAPTSPVHERIHFTGSVPTVVPWLRAADIAVVPLTDGGGTRMKILDYFAASLPVISTSKGIEGIPANHGKEALIIDQWPEFINAIADVWNNPEKAALLGKNGRAYAETLSWDEIAQRYMKVFRTISS